MVSEKCKSGIVHLRKWMERYQHRNEITDQRLAEIRQDLDRFADLIENTPNDDDIINVMEEMSQKLNTLFDMAGEIETVYRDCRDDY